MNLEVDRRRQDDRVPHGREGRRDAVRQGSHRRRRPHDVDRHRHRPRGVRRQQSGRPGMQAFMAGKVRVQGDMTKLMMAQGGGGRQPRAHRSPAGDHRVAPSASGRRRSGDRDQSSEVTASDHRRSRSRVRERVGEQPASTGRAPSPTCPDAASGGRVVAPCGTGASRRSPDASSGGHVVDPVQAARPGSHATLLDRGRAGPLVCRHRTVYLGR